MIQPIWPESLESVRNISKGPVNSLEMEQPSIQNWIHSLVSAVVFMLTAKDLKHDTEGFLVLGLYCYYSGGLQAVGWV